jgi:hypothetical protein
MVADDYQGIGTGLEIERRKEKKRKEQYYGMIWR